MNKLNIPQNMSSNDYFLAIDIGASSGRHMLGHYECNELVLDEIYRFEHDIVKKDNHCYWDINSIIENIIIGIKECYKYRANIKSIAIDTWAVDYVLINSEGNICAPVYSYRDNRTSDVPKKVYKKISKTDLYKRNGLQHQNFNTIFQLLSQNIPKDTYKILLIPDYINYYLTGVIACEYTNATTTGLVNINTKAWDYELMNILNINKDIFPSIILPGTKLGMLKEDIANTIGFNTCVYTTTSHDTASAVAAINNKDLKTVYISSGTWSLMGIETYKPYTVEAAIDNNFTNEGGYDYRYRFLKNIMGMWIIQQIRKEYNNANVNPISFDDINKNSYNYINTKKRIDVNSDVFVAPASMIEAIKENVYIEASFNESKTFENIYEMTACVYISLAIAYSKVIDNLELITNNTYDIINIVGGGSKATLLNELTQMYCKKRIITGPIEATATGNIYIQSHFKE